MYETACAAGLRREFLERYARRAAERLSNNARLIAPEEKAFWIDLVEKQLGVALAREGPDLLGMARAPQEVRRKLCSLLAEKSRQRLLIQPHDSR